MVFYRQKKIWHPVFDLTFSTLISPMESTQTPDAQRPVGKMETGAKRIAACCMLTAERSGMDNKPVSGPACS